jgi:hypothetical protein
MLGGHFNFPSLESKTGTARLRYAHLSESNIRKTFNLKVNNLSWFLRDLVKIKELPDYQEVVKRKFEDFITQRQFNSHQIQFLMVVQNMFLNK